MPLDPTFADPAVRGAAVEPGRLSAQALRRRFADPPAWHPELNTDPRLAQLQGPPRPAAVLVPLVQRADGLTVLLTQRTAHLNDHAGQISFPGGRAEDVDESARHTALRETEEEIGLAPEAVEVIGSLPDYVVATGYQVTPIVGVVERTFTLRLDEFEVAEVFEVPLAFLMDPANHERRSVEIDGVRRTFYAMPYQGRRRYFIWGATAAMLRNLYQFLRS
ncbi:MAG TPA: CoA pyrophosphatase [Burkholderiaceae bacterium]|nr:CoA pyrophosphatase [Burkholderiaceae bacterium]